MEPDVGNLDGQAELPPAAGGSPCHKRRRISDNDRQHGGDRESGVRTTGAVVGGVFLFKFRLPTYQGGEFQLGIGISKVLHHGIMVKMDLWKCNGAHPKAHIYKESNWRKFSRSLRPKRFLYRTRMKAGQLLCPTKPSLYQKRTC